MKPIAELLRSWQRISLTDEDGEVLSLDTFARVQDPAIHAFERQHDVTLPAEIKDLLQFSNGLSLFGLIILPLEEQEIHREQGLLSFHNWGNGDFDCVRIGNEVTDVTPVLFMNHSPEVTVQVACSLNEWMIGIL